MISLFISALGVAFTKHGELGVSPISSVANVMSVKLDFFSLGIWLIIWNCVLILGQILILRKKFKPIQLLQIPLSFLFGYFTDFGLWLVGFIPAESYIMRLVMVFIGIVILGFAVGFGKCYNELGRGFCKSNFRYDKQELRQCENSFRCKLCGAGTDTVAVVL